MKIRPPTDSEYVVQAVERACELIKALGASGEMLRLTDLASRTGLSSATAYRLLYTLEQCGFVRRESDKRYQSNLFVRSGTRFKIGYASQDEDSTFADVWSPGIANVASEREVKLIMLNNRADGRNTLNNIDRLIRERVELVIEHQFDERLAVEVARRCRDAGIPLIGMGAGHPGAVYFGGDNYFAGLLAGRCLGRWACKHWEGRARQLVLIELSRGGALLSSRMRGVEYGVRERLPDVDLETVRLTTDGTFGSALVAMRTHLRRTRASRLLIGAANDPCALGALMAIEEASRSEDCWVAGNGGSPESRIELRRLGTRMAGSVAFFAERYGEHLIRIALNILDGVRVPSAIFVKHELLTASNVDHYYPNDVIANCGPGDGSAT